MDEPSDIPPMSDEMEANFNEDIDAMEKLVEIVGNRLDDGQDSLGPC